MNVWEFMSNSPVLAFLLAVCVVNLFIGVAESIFRGRK